MKNQVSPDSPPSSCPSEAFTNLLPAWAWYASLEQDLPDAVSNQMVPYGSENKAAGAQPPRMMVTATSPVFVRFAMT